MWLSFSKIKRNSAHKLRYWERQIKMFKMRNYIYDQKITAQKISHQNANQRNNTKVWKVKIVIQHKAKHTRIV